jgi:tetratricopeptide (TPR) repeat protein
LVSFCSFKRTRHSKAADVLREALELQEEVLGETNATVLSTLDNLADSCANAGSYESALSNYQDLLRRFEAGSYQASGPKTARAKAVLLYKMSRVYRKQGNVTGQLDHLKMSLRYFRSQPPPVASTTTTTSAKSAGGSAGATATPIIDSLERQILYDIRAGRAALEKDRSLDRI